MRGLDAQECLCGRCATESFVRADADVVNERSGEAPFEVGLRERQVEAVEVCGFLERSPEPFQASCGVEVLGGSETLVGSESGHGLQEDSPGELAAQVGDEVLGVAEGAHGSAEKARHVNRARSRVEHLQGERRIRFRLVPGVCNPSRQSLAEILPASLNPNSYTVTLARSYAALVYDKDHEAEVPTPI
jgi:hypothetical protein